MRLFYALTFDNPTRQKLSGYRDWLADHTLKGRFTREDNFHITLAFLGNCRREQLKELGELIYQIGDVPHELKAERLGSFKVKGKELVWLGIERESSLMLFQKQLNKQLELLGYKTEKRKFTPHITLGRDVVMKANLSDLWIDPIVLPVRSVALMESKNVGDVLVYDMLFQKQPY